jgi:hypothetical protein
MAEETYRHSLHVGHRVEIEADRKSLARRATIPVNRRYMDVHENKKGDTESKPEAGTRDPKAKGAQRDENPDRGRTRVPNTESEMKDAKENKTSQEKVRVEQGGKHHRGNTN